MVEKLEKELAILHRHIGGLESKLKGGKLQAYLHRHIGGLEITGVS